MLLERTVPHAFYSMVSVEPVVEEYTGIIIVSV